MTSWIVPLKNWFAPEEFKPLARVRLLELLGILGLPVGLPILDMESLVPYLKNSPSVLAAPWSSAEYAYSRRSGEVCSRRD